MEFANTAICEMKPMPERTQLDYKNIINELKPSFTVRRPIRLRSPPNRIAFAVQSDCVRSPIRLRSPSDQIAFGARWGKIKFKSGFSTLLFAIVNDFT